MARSNTPDYTVGYKRPPRETQFRRGQSGNPMGRPKKTPAPTLPAGLSQESARILNLLSEGVSVVVDGRVRRVPCEEAVDRALIEQAMAGDIRAIKLVHERHAQALAAKEAIKEQGGIELTLHIAEALRFHARAKHLGLVDEVSGSVVGAEGPAPRGPEVWEDPGEPGAAAEAVDPFADIMAEEYAPAAPTYTPSHPDQPSAGAGEAPPPAPVSGMIFGNANTGPQPPRVRRQRRASSSEPLIKDNRPLTGHF